MWGARRLQQDIESELATVRQLLGTIRQNSHDPRTVEELANLIELSTQNIALMMQSDYENVTRLGNTAHEGRLAALEKMLAEQQRDLEELRKTLDELTVIHFRKRDAG
jgi:ATP-dependent DNA ligase